MVNKALRLVTIIILSIPLLFVVPFNDIYADTISNSNVNINYYLDSVTETATGTYMQTYKVEFVFDKSYLGWISSKMVGTYINNNTVPITTAQFTKTQSIYVNGAIAETSFSIVTTNSQNGGALQSLSQSIQNSNVTPLADLSTLDDILNVLTDINNNIEIDVIEELQNIVSNTSLSNDYLNMIRKIRSYDIPFESLLVTTYFNSYHEPEDIYLSGVYDFKFPIYKMSGRCFRLYGNAGHQYKMIVLSKSSTTSSFNNSFSTSPNTGMSLVSSLYSGNTYFFRQSYLYLMTYTFSCTTSNNYYFDYVGNDTSYYIVPIYYGDVNNKNISTDFALRFGLSNSLLDNIQLIANGTNASSAASSQSNQANLQLQQDSNTLFTQEDSFKQNMQQSMNNIDTTFSLNNFGSSFMTSAQWVRTQYETLTNNTPFASLITFSLLVGLALIVIGKVYK